MTTQERDAYIVSQINGGRPGAEVAKQLAMGRGHVYNIFKRETGRNPGARSTEPAAIATTASHSPSVMEELAGRIEPTSCKLPDGLTMERWSEIVNGLLVMAEGAQWWLGDALLYGERSYGETYAQVAEVTGKSVQTLQNTMWVAKQIAPSRRRETLSWSHHEVVAAMEPIQADGWLDIAEEEGLTRNQLRARVAEARTMMAPRKEPPAIAPATPTAPAPATSTRATDGLGQFFSTMEPEVAPLIIDRPTLPEPERSLRNDPVPAPSEQSGIGDDQVSEEWVLRVIDLAEAVRTLVFDFSDIPARRAVTDALTRYDAATGAPE